MTDCCLKSLMGWIGREGNGRERKGREVKEGEGKGREGYLMIVSVYEYGYEYGYAYTYAYEERMT